MKNKRSVILINPKFQLKIIFYFFIMAMVTVTLVFGANFYFIYKLKLLGLKLNLSVNDVYFQFLGTQQDYLIKILIILSVFASIFILSFGLFLSHRIAGPIYAINRFIDSHIEGKTTPPLKFRKNDFFPEIAEKINVLVAFIKSQR